MKTVDMSNTNSDGNADQLSDAIAKYIQEISKT